MRDEVSFTLVTETLSVTFFTYFRVGGASIKASGLLACASEVSQLSRQVSLEIACFWVTHPSSKITFTLYWFNYYFNTIFRASGGDGGVSGLSGEATTSSQEKSALLLVTNLFMP